MSDEAVAVVGDLKDAAGGDGSAALAQGLDGAVDQLITPQCCAGGHVEEVGEAGGIVTVKGLKLGDGDVLEGLRQINDTRLTRGGLRIAVVSVGGRAGTLRSFATVRSFASSLPCPGGAVGGAWTGGAA